MPTMALSSKDMSELESREDLGVLNRLQSQDHEEILNVIDKLRSEGISRYVDLPQLIVCGDQSSGKSSVLEAISGLNFPTKENVCTRFATELILRRAPASKIQVSIYPDPERPEREQSRLRSFEAPTLALDSFAEIVRSAEKIMGVGEDDRPFSKDVLRVEVSSPTQPHLTLVDLPGLYHAPDENQDVDGITFVESLVRSYMVNPRSVTLAVISAKNEIALQKVTALTREIDPEGVRTLGIITKPDTLPEGSDLQRSFYHLAQNKKVDFRLGWHVLKNRTFEERNCSLEDRERLETKFLSQGVWGSLPRSEVGIKALVRRLSTVLKDHVLSQMPSFVADTQLSFKDTKILLQRMGDARSTLLEQRRYLSRGSEKFSTLMNNSLNGVYLDPFFGDSLDDAGYQKRLRAVVQNRLSHFAESMRDRGENRRIVDDGAEHDPRRRCIYRTDFIEEVRKRMCQSRGRELPGNFNSSIIGELFYQQARPWEDIVDQYTDYLLEDVRSATILTLQDVLDQHSVEGLLRLDLNHRLSELEDDLRAKTRELLNPQKSGHPITYNSQYIEIIQDTRDRHLRDSIVKKLKAFFGDNYPDNPHASGSFYFRMQDLIDNVTTQTELDMERFACSEAIDCMQAFYSVALRKFVDDFSNLAVEKCLLEPLGHIFSLHVVETMTGDIVQDIACEDESTTIERQRLTNKLVVLENCLRCLQHLDKGNLTASRASCKEGKRPERETQLADPESNCQPSRADSDRFSSPVLLSVDDEVLNEEHPDVPDEWAEPASSSASKKKKKHRNASLWE